MQHLIDKVTVSSDRIIVELNRQELVSALGLTAHVRSIDDDDEPVRITSPFQHRKRGVESKLVLGLSSLADPDAVLITKIAKARSWLEDIKNGKSVSTVAS